MTITMNDETDGNVDAEVAQLCDLLGDLHCDLLCGLLCGAMGWRDVYVAAGQGGWRRGTDWAKVCYSTTWSLANFSRSFFSPALWKKMMAARLSDSPSTRSTLP